MSVLHDTWRQLVRRRLWPVAIVLVAALVAVPQLLSEDPAPVAAPAPPPAASGGKGAVAATDPIVTLASDPQRRTRVLGDKRDPFTPSGPQPKASKASEAPSQDAGGSAPGAGGDAGGGGAPEAPGTPDTQPEPNKTYEQYELTVRFGAAEDGTPPERDIKRLRALPSAEEPVLIYLGVEDDGKTAVFLVDAGVMAEGDGECKPDPANCEELHLREGETEFLELTTGAEDGQGEDGEDGEEGSTTVQYQIDLVKIHRRKAGSASTSRARESKAGRRLLNARISRRGPLRYRYDAEDGTLERLSPRAYKAAVRAAKAARARAKVARARD